MTEIINYYFNPDDALRPYTVSALANPNSLAPVNALRITPTFEDGKHPCESDGKWVLIEDNRGITVYSTESKQSIEIKKLGAIPDGFTKLAPVNSYDKWDGEKWAEDEVLKAEYINSINQATIKSLVAEATLEIDILQDAINADEAEDGDDDKLKNWRKYRVLLRKVDTSVEEMELPEKPAS